MNIYKKITKEHMFVFLIIFTALVFFNYFEDFNYTGLVIQETCSDKNHVCCYFSEGEGVNYFSLDDTCDGNKGCWDSCEVNEVKNLITGDVSFIDNVWDWFKNLFKKKAVGFVGTAAQCQGKNPLFYISSLVGEGHASKNPDFGTDSTYWVCSDKIKLQGGTIDLIALSGDTNAHVGEIVSGSVNVYDKIIKVAPSEGFSQINIYYQADLCTLGDEGLFSISDDTSAHVAPYDFASYSLKACLSYDDEPCDILTPPRNCPKDQGVCSGIVQTCEGGVWSTCDYGLDYEFSEETCDGVADNDCDGKTDNVDPDCPQGITNCCQCDIGEDPYAYTVDPSEVSNENECEQYCLNRGYGVWGDNYFKENAEASANHYFCDYITPPPELCGDGFKDADEECDDGNSNNNDACLNTCQNAECGDGYIWSGVETCDDGNNNDLDGCSSTCQIEEGGDSCVSKEGTVCLINEECKGNGDTNVAFTPANENTCCLNNQGRCVVSGRSIYDLKEPNTIINYLDAIEVIDHFNNPVTSGTLKYDLNFNIIVGLGDSVINYKDAIAVIDHFS